MYEKLIILIFLISKYVVGARIEDAINNSKSASGCFNFIKNDYLMYTKGEGFQLQLTTTDSELEPRWLAIIYLYKDSIEKIHLDQCRTYAWEFGEARDEYDYCGPEHYERRWKYYFTKNDSVIVADLNGNNSIVSLEFLENGRYCYDAVNLRVIQDESMITSSIIHPNCSIDSRDWMDLYTSLISSISCFIFIYPLIRKWQNQVSTPLRITQIIYLYYIPSHVISPFWQQTFPTIADAILTEEQVIRYRIYPISFAITTAIQFFTGILQRFYMLLVSFGFDSLPRDKYKLISRQYLFVWLLTIVGALTDICLLYGLSYFRLLRNLCEIVFIITLFVQYFKTRNWLSSSMSITFPIRLRKYLEAVFWLYLSLILYGTIYFLYVILWKETVNRTSLAGLSYPIFILFSNWLDAILVCYVLNNYWTPELLEKEKIGSLATDIELENVKVD